MKNGKKQKISRETANAQTQGNQQPETAETSRAAIIQRLKITQDKIRNGEHDTRAHVVRDVNSAIALLRGIAENDELLDQIAKAVEKSILSIPTDHAD